MHNFAVDFPHGLTYHEFLATYGSEAHQRRWAAVYDRVQLTTPQRDVLLSFVRQIKVLCLAGTWCVESMAHCPVIQRFVEAAPQIETRYFERDTHPDLQRELRLCGGDRIPVFVFLSEDDYFLGLYGNRTLAKLRHLAAKEIGAGCSIGSTPPEQALIDAITQELLNEFERMHWTLRLSTRLRELHGD